MNGRTNSAGGTLASDMEIPLDPCTDFVGVRIKDLEYLGKVRLTWTDPKDKYATPEGEAMEDTDQLVSKWSYTQIVRQADRAPVNPSDGVTVCTETTRNQYQTIGFIDTTAESNVTYYYGAYAFNEDGVYSEVISNGVQPISFSTTLADNTWEEIDQACTLGLAESLWEIGDTKDIQYQHPMYEPGELSSINCCIIGFNHDDLSDGTGKAVITFASRSDFTTAKYFDKSSYGVKYNESTLRTECNDLYSTMMTSEIKNVIKPVIKRSSGTYDSSSNSHYVKDGEVTSTDYCFAFSLTELGYQILEGYEDNVYIDFNDGAIYPYFTTSANRRLPSITYWTRTAARAYRYDFWDPVTNYYAWVIQEQTSGTSSDFVNDRQNDYNDIIFGFCIGKVAV